ncbi:MAG: glycoside hydrolase family 10 protein [Ferruginibacter sp.]
MAFLLSCMFTMHSWAQSNPQQEFRGVWITTAFNKDWPTLGVTNSDSQKVAFIRQLDFHKKNGINAVIVQVRVAADAFYPSPYEPWSQWLIGIQGKAPEPYYDPLQFMITEAHKRGFEFHAWCNPYRAVSSIQFSSVDSNHITYKHPEWFVDYGKSRYFNPAKKECRDFITTVITDIVQRYEVDAIHLDDYFYPSKIDSIPYPDSALFVSAASTLSKDDWRRENVNKLIEQLHTAIKKIKPWVKFGVAPFSVWRNKSKDPLGSESDAWQTNYDDLYADVILWLKRGWVDYVAPQLFLDIGHTKIPFEKMIAWWSKNSYGKHVYIGHGVYRHIPKENTMVKRVKPNELPNQIKLTRKYPTIKGSIFYSSTSFDANPNGWNDSLQNNYYKTSATIPIMNWLPVKHN